MLVLLKNHVFILHFCKTINPGFLRCFRVPRIENRVPRIREIYHRVPRVRENRFPRIRYFGSLHVHTE